MSLYFAASLSRNRIHCKYMAGLGALGLGSADEAIQYLSDVIKLDRSHPGSQDHLAMARESLKIRLTRPAAS